MQTEFRANDDMSEIEALERFVVENDELLELEERIGRFNIFDALRIDRAEIRHSNFLAWLLDPNESHGQGSLFLRAILMDLLRTARQSGFACPVSPIDLDGEELRGVEIRREWKNIDLLIVCKEPQFIIAIENKIGSAEHGDQLTRYRRTVAEHFGSEPCLYVFLTVEGDEASKLRRMTGCRIAMPMCTACWNEYATPAPQPSATTCLRFLTTICDF